MEHEPCPLRGCTWHVLRNWADPQLHPVTQARLLEHLRAEHLYELQLMVAGADGGHGAPVTASVTQHIDARQVQDAADLVVSVLVPQMRASWPGSWRSRTCGRWTRGRLCRCAGSGGRTSSCSSTRTRPAGCVPRRTARSRTCGHWSCPPRPCRTPAR